MSRCLDFSDRERFTVEEIITDASTSVAKVLGTVHVICCVISMVYGYICGEGTIVDLFAYTVILLLIETQYPSVYHHR